MQASFIMLVGVVCGLVLPGWAQAPSVPDEYQVLQEQIKRFREMRKWARSTDVSNLASWAGYHPSWAELERQTHRKEALIVESDHDPLDVVLRRTAALLESIRSMPAVRNLSAEARELNELAQHAKQAEVVDGQKRRALFSQACLLRRQIALANPLLSFDKLLFITRNFGPFNEWQGDHMVWQRYGRNAFPGGVTGASTYWRMLSGPRRLCAMCLPRQMPICGNGRFAGKKLPPGGFLSPSLSYDGKTVLFARLR